jgi:hypothetical protein
LGPLGASAAAPSSAWAARGLVASALAFGLSACSFNATPAPSSSTQRRAQHTQLDASGVVRLEQAPSSLAELDDAGVLTTNGGAGQGAEAVDGGAALPPSAHDASSSTPAPDAGVLDAGELVDAGARCFYRCAGVCQLWPCP